MCSNKKIIFRQVGAELGQAQLKLGLGFTQTNLHQIDEQESSKHPLATHLLFTAPQQSPNIAITNLTLFILSYRVFTKTVSTFVFWIYRLPKGLDIPSWTFFNTPYRVDFRDIHFLIVRWNIDGDIDKILQESHFKSQHFQLIVVSSVWALMMAHEHLWALRITQENGATVTIAFLRLISAHDTMAPC